MDITGNQVIHTYLVEQKDFLVALQDNFDENQIEEIINYLKNINTNYPGIMDQFYDWIHDEEGKINILSIGWDSKNWGAGGNGFISFDLVSEFAVRILR